VHVPAPDDLNDVDVANEHPALPASVTAYEYPPKPVPPDADRETLVLNVPEVEVSVTTLCVALPMVTVVATELALT
jgi:hypothetical protein